MGRWVESLKLLGLPLLLAIDQGVAWFGMLVVVMNPEVCRVC